jgi:DNA-binding CsgD family transcriptional regulator
VTVPTPIVSAVAAQSAPLNAYEARIARLVAEGHSNRRVGEILGVSSRAVEHHLTRVYRKLSIAGRGQLGRAVPPEHRSGHDSTGIKPFRN